MATEHPRQHVWTGDDYGSLTYMIQIGRSPNHTHHRFIVRSRIVTVALAQAISAVVPIPDEWGEIHTSIRPLKAFEVMKVTLKEGEVIELDDASYIHLTNGEQDD